MPLQIPEELTRKEMIEPHLEKTGRYWAFWEIATVVLYDCNEMRCSIEVQRYGKVESFRWTSVLKALIGWICLVVSVDLLDPG